MAQARRAPLPQRARHLPGQSSEFAGSDSAHRAALAEKHVDEGRESTCCFVASFAATGRSNDEMALFSILSARDQQLAPPPLHYRPSLACPSAPPASRGAPLAECRRGLRPCSSYYLHESPSGSYLSRTLKIYFLVRHTKFLSVSKSTTYTKKKQQTSINNFAREKRPDSQERKRN